MSDKTQTPGSEFKLIKLENMLVYQIDKKCNPSYKFTDSNRHDGHFAYIGVMHVNKICLVSVILDLEDL